MSQGLAVVLTFAAATITPTLRAQAQERSRSNISPTRFTVRIENVSTEKTLRLSRGGSMEIPLSPVVWTVHTAGNPLLTPGQVESGLGLKGLAEAGMAGPFEENLSGVSGVVSHGVAATPIVPPPPKGGSAPTPDPLLQPGYRYVFTIEARPGDRLSFATMLGPSNDGVVATGADGIALFDASGRPAAGDVTSQLFLWDAGTEVNEEPGLGPNQGLQQNAPNAGDPERRPVRLMSDAEFGRLWPPVRRIVRVTLTPAAR